MSIENISIKASQLNSRLRVVSTGLEDFDVILGGGLPVGSLVILLGAPGSGKTTLLQQLCFAWTSNRTSTEQTSTADATSKPNKAITQTATAKTLYFSTLSEPHEKLVQHLSQFTFFDENKIGSAVKLFSLTHAMKTENANELATFIVKTARQEKAELIAIDGMGALIDLFNQPRDTRYFLNQLSTQLNALGVTCILSLEESFADTTNGSVLTAADGIVSMSTQRTSAAEYHRIEVRKLRGMPRLEGLHTYVFSQQGIIFYPRLEALTRQNLTSNSLAFSLIEEQNATTSLTNTAESYERLGFGLPELEKMLEGGLPAGSSTFITGSPGVGKTLLGLHFLMEGAAKGETGLYVGFYEEQRRLIQNATNFKLDLAGAIRQGTVKVLAVSSVELEPDQVAYLIRQAVEKYHVQRVVIDGILELELACREEGRSRAFTSAIDSYFKAQGVTALYTYVISKIIGNDLDLSDTVFTALTENLILMRQIPYQSQMYRIISVLKMRDSDYDTSIRQFTIKRQEGIRVLEPLESGTEWLRGLSQNLGETQGQTS